MNSKDIIIGEWYRHKDHPNYCWAKALEVIPPRQRENTTNKILVKCEWCVNQNDAIRLTKYFSAKDLVKK